MSITFDRFELDLERRELLGDGAAVHLSPKAFQLLHLLAAAVPRALSKQELTDAIWPDTFVEECNLPGLVAELRERLSDDARQPRFIRTLHGFGYAFCAELLVREHRAWLRVDGREVQLYEGGNIIGRDAQATVRIDDATVSRRHARITIRGGEATLEDLGSKNGTFMAGVRIAAPAILHEGDAVVIGEIHVTFSHAPANAATLTLHRD